MNLSGNPKVALVHDYLNQYGGAERTLEKIMEIFPNAPIFTGIYDPTKFGENFHQRKIITPKLNFIFKKFPKLFTFLMGSRFENFDVSEYDLIISDGTAWAKSVVTTSNQLHISYIHTPPRFLYKYSSESRLRKNPFLKIIFLYLDFKLRIWDLASSKRPDFLLCNSTEVQKRIKKFYNRDALVIYPPVRTKEYQEVEREEFYLISGRLSSYKNFDLVINLFNKLGKELVVIGTGAEEDNLKKLAKSNIKFLGRVSDEILDEYLWKSKGYLFPVVEEDFGIALVEALNHGNPALCHYSGGPKEIMREGIDGIFFQDLSVESLEKKFLDFDQKISSGEFDRRKISEYARRFDEKLFIEKFQSFVTSKWEEFKKSQ